MATSATAAYPGSGAGSERVMAISRRIDFAEYSDKLTANSVIEAIQVKANTLVQAAGVRVVTVNGAAVTLDLGDGTSGNSDRYVDNVNGNSATQASAYGRGGGTLGTYREGIGVYYSADDTIDITVASGTASTALVVDVWAIVVDLNFYETTESIEDSIAVA